MILHTMLCPDCGRAGLSYSVEELIDRTPTQCSRCGVEHKPTTRMIAELFDSLVERLDNLEARVG